MGDSKESDEIDLLMLRGYIEGASDGNVYYANELLRRLQRNLDAGETPNPELATYFIDAFGKILKGDAPTAALNLNRRRGKNYDRSGFAMSQKAVHALVYLAVAKYMKKDNLREACRKASKEIETLKSKKRKIGFRLALSPKTCEDYYKKVCAHSENYQPLIQRHVAKRKKRRQGG